MDAKENNKFDHLVKQKLTTKQPVYEAGSWEALSNRMDQLEAEKQFDIAVNDKLEEIRPAYKVSSWAMIAERLELEKQRVQAVATYKSLELALLLLFFLGFQFVYLGSVNKTPPATTPIVETQPFATLEKIQEETLLENSADPINSKQEKIEIQSTIELAEEALFADANIEIFDISLTKEPTAQTIDLTGIEILPIRHDEVQNQLPRQGLNIVKSIQATQSLPVQVYSPEAQVLASSVESVSLGVIANLERSAISLIEYGESNSLDKKVNLSKSKTHLRIGFIGSPNYDRVITPPTVLESDQVVSFDRYSLGYSGGLTLGLERGKFEMETGLIYAARQYQSIPAVYVSGSIKSGGYSGLSLWNFELNTFNVPLNFKYNFIHHDKWRMHLVAGASLNVVVQANYYTVDDSAFDNLERDGLQRNGEQDNAPTEAAAAIKNKPLKKGWLEGGAFWQNSTLFGNLGLGLERYISPQFSVFTQPTYQHSFPVFNSGLGPYNDRLHSFSIFMGLKVRL